MSKKAQARLRVTAHWLPLAAGASSCNLAIAIFDISVFTSLFSFSLSLSLFQLRALNKDWAE